MILPIRNCLENFILKKIKNHIPNTNKERSLKWGIEEIKKKEGKSRV